MMHNFCGVKKGIEHDLYLTFAYSSLLRVCHSEFYLFDSGSNLKGQDSSSVMISSKKLSSSAYSCFSFSQTATRLCFYSSLKTSAHVLRKSSDTILGTLDLGMSSKSNINPILNRRSVFNNFWHSFDTVFAPRRRRVCLTNFVGDVLSALQERLVSSVRLGIERGDLSRKFAKVFKKFLPVSF